MYAIIGAGPMGLCTARQLKKYGIDFVGFEPHSDVGGLWDIDNPHSSMYHSAHLISSKGTTEFREFLMCAEVAPYPHHSEMRRYFRDYARLFRIYEHYQFDTGVLQVQREQDGWKLISERNGEQGEWRFDGVLIANGTLHTPNLPRLPGDFCGELLHSNAYKSADIFAGKRVLVVGCGNSACDIAVDAVHRAASVDLSVRRGYHFLPKFILGKPTDTFGGAIKLPRVSNSWSTVCWCAPWSANPRSTVCPTRTTACSRCCTVSPAFPAGWRTGCCAATSAGRPCQRPSSCAWKDST
ncbi:putative oxidoreductase CzcO [Pseudomonas oleovorans subsp. oleovorans]|uniref:Flavin-containing monooxygenase n=2 Tax=Ectopseudomonas oleovorans TaxID=301 RepID=A0A061CXE6_ECTOL|nr:putative oxidoreductase CzcO [Pseudomonas oleovorans subsp. oleovorans]CDM40594.1 flavin-binding monooxygenase-like protein [Pseudomonas oleovorans CECT 5344]CDR91224.1 flavin-binding monooxygenase-like protein [Pseudomonas oleovorans]SEJ62314.1 Flavin-binding monooxygenase-like [Pseudomonas oleovorans]SUD53492.1 flavin-containing monooxygenase [Pseudomonas oleovorans]